MAQSLHLKKLLQATNTNSLILTILLKILKTYSRLTMKIMRNLFLRSNSAALTLMTTSGYLTTHTRKASRHRRVAEEAGSGTLETIRQRKGHPAVNSVIGHLLRIWWMNSNLEMNACLHLFIRRVICIMSGIAQWKNCPSIQSGPRRVTSLKSMVVNGMLSQALFREIIRVTLITNVFIVLRK